jgi:hypothetical protein
MISRTHFNPSLTLNHSPNLGSAIVMLPKQKLTRNDHQ